MLADAAALFGRGRELAIAPASGGAIAGNAKRRRRLWLGRPTRVRDRIDVLQHRLHDLVGEVGIGDDPEAQTGDRLVALFGKARLEGARWRCTSCRTVFASQGVAKTTLACRGFRYAARAKPARVIRWISRTMVSSALPCGNSVSLMARSTAIASVPPGRDPGGAPARRSWRGGRMIRSRPSRSWIRRLCHPRI